MKGGPTSLRVPETAVMSDEQQTDDPTGIPDIPVFPQCDDGSQRIVRRPRANRTPVAALAVAVLLGGGLAWGVVAMIPDSWKHRWKRGAEASRTSDGGETNTPADGADGPSPIVPDGPAPVIPLRTERKPQAGGDAIEDADARLARRMEERAAELLADAKRLHSKRLTKAAVRVLEDLRNRYPDTKAAVEAEKLLLKID
jgi:hypothetical protein